MKTFKHFFAELLAQLPEPQVGYVDEIFWGDDSDELFQIIEGKLASGRFPNNIRFDSNAYGAGQPHAHIHGRRGDVLGVVNLDGSGSHGTKMRLHSKDADTLRKNGYSVRPENIVEWIEICTIQQILLE